MGTRVIGLAGRPGSGKSAVARALAERADVEAVDLDRVAWETYRPGTPTYGRLIGRFGADILSEDGRIDRRELARRSLSEPAARRDLEAIVHPAVTERLSARRREAERRGVGTLIVEGALLAHSPHVDRSIFDAILWLEASASTRRRRLRADGREEQADRMDDVRPGGRAIVIDGEGPLSEVVERVRRAIGF